MTQEQMDRQFTTPRTSTLRLVYPDRVSQIKEVIVCHEGGPVLRQHVYRGNAHLGAQGD